MIIADYGLSLPDWPLSDRLSQLRLIFGALRELTKTLLLAL